jgi:transcriptional regulator with XRE-family HTH domain
MKQLAATVGVTEAAISHYETGRREPDPDMLGRIANALGVTVDYLLGRETPPTHDLGDGETKAAPADMRAEAKRLMESMTDEQYQAALQYLKFLQSQEKQS